MRRAPFPEPILSPSAEMGEGLSGGSVRRSLQPDGGSLPGSGKALPGRTAPLPGAEKVLPRASSQRHEPRGTDPGEQLWFSVFPSMSPSGGRPHFPRRPGTAGAGTEDAKASPGIHRGRGARGRGEPDRGSGFLGRGAESGGDGAHRWPSRASRPSRLFKQGCFQKLDRFQKLVHLTLEPRI